METQEKEYYIPMELNEQNKNYESEHRRNIQWCRIGSKKVKCIMVKSTKQAYEEYMRPIWRENKRKQRAYKDYKENSNQDYKSSNVSCNAQGTGLPISLDLAKETSGFDIEDSFNLESSVMFDNIMERFLLMLAEINDEDAKIIRLFFIEEYSQREISKMVGVSQGTVSNRINKYRDIFKEEFSD